MTSEAEEKGKSPLIVTRGDGIPLPDQAAALEEFKRQCLSSVKPGAAICSPETVERLVDAAFRELQHDTGPTNPEYVHQRRILVNEFARILCVRKRR